MIVRRVFISTALLLCLANPGFAVEEEVKHDFECVEKESPLFASVQSELTKVWEKKYKIVFVDTFGLGAGTGISRFNQTFLWLGTLADLGDYDSGEKFCSTIHIFVQNDDQKNAIAELVKLKLLKPTVELVAKGKKVVVPIMIVEANFTF